MIEVLLFAAATVQATSQPAAVDAPDDRVAELGGKDALLTNDLGDGFYKEESNRAALLRIGLSQGCPLYLWAVNVAVTKNRGQFRPLLIKEMRKTIPATEMAQPRISTGLWGTLARYRPAVEAGLRISADRVFANLEQDFKVAWSLAAKAMPAAPPGTAEVIFGDWDLQRPTALRAACMLIGNGADPAALEQRKSVFDQFFKKGSK